MMARRTGSSVRSFLVVASIYAAPTFGQSSAIVPHPSAQVPIIQPGAPGEPSRQISAEEATDLASIQYSAADVSFMQGMITHHAQAIEMTVLVEDRTARDVMLLLSQRIELSQEDEIAMMRDWLQDRGQDVPDLAVHHQLDGELMPGMATPEQMQALVDSDGTDFDNLFLELMIEHHRGALTMVDNLLEQPAAAQDTVLYQFTAEITADQSAEIGRMDAMLAGFSPDPRVNLQAGYLDAEIASFNMELVRSIPRPAGFFDPRYPAGMPAERQPPGLENTPDLRDEFEDLRESSENEEAGVEKEDEQEDPRPALLNFANTDLAFSGSVVIAGNYHGFNIYDISDPLAPELLSSVVCPGGQGDVSIVGDLLILSVEQMRGRLDCGLQGVAEPESEERFRGIRLFDVSDFRLPRQVGAVQTCRGSHTHTVVTDPDDDNNIFVYGSGTGSVRPGDELEGCVDESPFEDPETALFRIDVIRIPLDRPQDAGIVSRPYVFSDPETGVIAGLWDGGDHGPGTQDTRETNQCHDITTFPDLGLAAGACSGNGILFDISEPENPVRIDEVIDTGFAYWHSATFNNDGTKILFTDEWGGGGRPRCRASDPVTWGANAIYDIVDNELQFRSHFKLPAPQTEFENCVAHNGSLVPVPGRDVFVQAWYQGGISVMDFTDSSNPIEIAFFDRGPLDDEDLIFGGYWSAYWFGGLIYGTEITRGLDVLTLTPSVYLTENEIAAASLGRSDLVFNPQQQRRHVWPADPVVALAYVDQLERTEVVEAAEASALTDVLQRVKSLADSGVSRDLNVAADLVALSRSVEAKTRRSSETTRSRVAGLAETMEALAAQFR